VLDNHRALSGHAATAPQLGRHEIDTSGSTITFRTRHLFGLAPVRGTFPDPDRALTVGGVTRPVILAIEVRCDRR
jgi:hypothetical protein